MWPKEGPGKARGLGEPLLDRDSHLEAGACPSARSPYHRSPNVYFNLFISLLPSSFPPTSSGVLAALWPALLNIATPASNNRLGRPLES